MAEQRNWYTQQEVAEILGVTKSTVYHYAKQGKIKKIADPFRSYRYARYEKEDVDKLAERIKNRPKGYRPSEVAKELGLTVQAVLKHIRNGNIEASKVKVGDERSYYIISEESLEKAKKRFSPSPNILIRKSEYYNSKLNVALFQLFYSPNGEPARITIHENDWGFRISKENHWVPYEEGIYHYELKPAYDINNNFIESKGFIHFEIPFGEPILYLFIDYLYSVLGVENVRIREQKNSVYIMAKVGEWSFDNTQFSYIELLPFIQKGKARLFEGKIIFSSSYTKTSIELPENMLNRIKQLAKHRDLTLSQLIEEVMEDYLNKQDKYNL